MALRRIAVEREKLPNASWPGGSEQRRDARLTIAAQNVSNAGTWP